MCVLATQLQFIPVILFAVAVIVIGVVVFVFVLMHVGQSVATSNCLHSNAFC